MASSSPRGGSAVGPAASVRPLAPVFISYRTSDGDDIAAALAWALRATGVPVWHDITDLPPGDTERRLQEALTSGMSGAVLVVTPDIRHSRIVREIEVPSLLALERDAAFIFAIGSVIPRPRPDGGSAAGPGVDYAAPDALLAKPAGTLARFTQYPVFDDAGIVVLAREIASQRMAAVRALSSNDLLLDIQTRLDPRGTPPEVPLAVRTKPPSSGQRLPDPEIWRPFGAFLTDLPRLLSIAGARRLRVRGGAHLTAAFALGAAVPTTSAWAVDVEDQAGSTWGEPIGQSRTRAIALREEIQSAESSTAVGAPVAVYVDLVPPLPPGDAFAEHIAGHPGRYARAVRLHLARREPIRPDAASSLVAELSQRIRACAGLASTHRVHLFLRTPFPIAVLLGRTLNTLEITLYEWDDTGTIPRYVKAITVASGRGGGPIVFE
jgi:SMODS-associated and fused to various effectors sensor domain/TIR domain